MGILLMEFLLILEVNVLTGDEAKAVWTKLRNCHRDALRRQKKCLKSGAAATRTKQWKYQKQMEFLLPYMANRPREGNLLDDDGDNIEEAMQQTEDVDSELMEGETLGAEEMPENGGDIGEADNFISDTPTDIDVGHITGSEDNNDKEQSEQSKRSATGEVPVRTTSSLRNKKRKKDDISNLLKLSIQQREKRAEERALERKKMDKENDHLYHFFISMYELTKKMPPSFQHMARNNVFQAVSQVEADYLQMLTHSQPGSQQQYSQYSQQISQTIPFANNPQTHLSNLSIAVLSPSSSTSTSSLMQSPNSDNKHQQLQPQYCQQAVIHIPYSNPSTPQSENPYASTPSSADTPADNYYKTTMK